MNVVYENICYHMNNIINSFYNKGIHLESQWIVDDTDFCAICERLIYNFRVLPIFIRVDKNVFIYRMSGLYFRLRLSPVESKVLVLLDFETKNRLIPEIYDNGCDEVFILANVIDFINCSIEGQQQRNEIIPASDFHLFGNLDIIVSNIIKLCSAKLIRASKTDFIVEARGMLIKGEFNYNNDDDGSDNCIIKLKANIHDSNSFGFLE